MTTPKHTPGPKANALLMAAAPEMLDALRKAQWALQQPHDNWKSECERKALDKIRAVIQKTEE